MSGRRGASSARAIPAPTIVSAARSAAIGCNEGRPTPAAPVALLSVQCKHEQRRTTLEIFELRSGFQKAQIPRNPAADMDRDILLATDRIADWWGAHRRADI